jgi:flagellar motility protein MotE (MotC chaperone)
MAKVLEKPAQVKPEPKGEDKKNIDNKGNDSKYTVIGIVSAILILLLVFGATFTIMLKTNTAGLADKCRTSLQGIPVLKYALPKAADPEDPKNFTQSELIDKYNALRKQNQDLQAKEKDLNSQLADLMKYKANEEKRTADATAKLTDAQNLKKQVDDANAKLAADKQAFDSVVANADKQGFKTYYEQVNKDTAQKIYAQIVTEQKISDDTKKYVQIYEQMDAKKAAQILEQVGKSDMNLVVDILKNMSRDKVAKILPEMTTEFAANVSQKLSAVYMSK